MPKGFHIKVRKSRAINYYTPHEKHSAWFEIVSGNGTTVCTSMIYDKFGQCKRMADKVGAQCGMEVKVVERQDYYKS